VLLLGIDGADWDIIDPLVSAGRMPNLERLMDGGHRADLQSLPSLFSPQVWTTIVTGHLPEVHGILGWHQGKGDLRVGTIWHQLKREGRSFGLCDWYFTWPPEPGRGDKDFIVPTHLSLGDETFPPEYSFYRSIEGLERGREKTSAVAGAFQYLSFGRDAWRHGIRLSTFRSALTMVVLRRFTSQSREDLKWRARSVYAAFEADTFAELLHRRNPEFAAVLFTQVDTISHWFWKYMEPHLFPDVEAEKCARYGSVITDRYVCADGP
jgi:hypothetical protein